MQAKHAPRAPKKKQAEGSRATLAHGARRRSVQALCEVKQEVLGGQTVLLKKGCVRLLPENQIA